jgi:hypothetical protein
MLPDLSLVDRTHITIADPDLLVNAFASCSLNRERSYMSQVLVYTSIIAGLAIWRCWDEGSAAEGKSIRALS